MRRLCRFAIFICAEESYIEVITRIGEIVIVAAEETNLFFNGKDKANVRVLFEAIEPVFTAAIERDNFAFET